MLEVKADFKARPHGAARGASESAPGATSLPRASLRWGQWNNIGKVIKGQTSASQQAVMGIKETVLSDAFQMNVKWI